MGIKMSVFIYFLIRLIKNTISKDEEEIPFTTSYDVISFGIPVNNKDISVYTTSSDSEHNILFIRYLKSQKQDYTKTTKISKFNYVEYFKILTTDTIFLCSQTSLYSITYQEGSIDQITEILNQYVYDTSDGIICFRSYAKENNEVNPYIFITYLNTNLIYSYNVKDNIFKIISDTTRVNKIISLAIQRDNPKELETNINDIDQVTIFSSTNDNNFMLSNYKYKNITKTIELFSDTLYYSSQFYLHEETIISHIPGTSLVIIFSYTPGTSNQKYYIINTTSNKVHQQIDRFYFNDPLETLIFAEFVYKDSSTSLLFFHIMNEKTRLLTIGVYDIFNSIIIQQQNIPNTSVPIGFGALNRNSNIDYYLFVYSQDKNLMYNTCLFFRHNKKCLLSCEQNEKDKHGVVDYATTNTCSEICPKTTSKFYWKNKDISTTLCLITCPRGFNNVDTICEKCPNDKPYFIDNKCMESCPYKYHADSLKQCLTCKQIGKLYLKSSDSCVDRCPWYMIYSDDLSECLTCEEKNSLTPYYYKMGECTNKCDYDIKDNICFSCPSDKIENYTFKSGVYEWSCVDRCESNPVIYGKYNQRCIICSAFDKVYYPSSLSCEDKCDLVYDNQTEECNYCIHPLIYDSLLLRCVGNCGVGGEIVNGKCVYCKGMLIYNNQCVQSCPQYHILEGNKCVKCKEGWYYSTDTNKCVERCPYGSIYSTVPYDNEIKICGKCKWYYNAITKTCNNSCPDGYISSEWDNGVKTCKLNCFETCGLCSIVGDDTNHKCLICKAGYYSWSTNTYQCYKKEEKIEWFYFDNNTGQFEQCHKNCKYCTEKGDDDNNKCSECAHSYYFDFLNNQANDKMNCIEKKVIDDNLYIAVNPLYNWGVEEDLNNELESFGKLSSKEQVNAIKVKINELQTESPAKTKSNNERKLINWLQITKMVTIHTTSSNQPSSDVLTQWIESINEMWVCDELTQSPNSKETILISELAWYYTSESINNKITWNSKYKEIINSIIDCFIGNSNTMYDTLLATQGLDSIDKDLITLGKEDSVNILSSTLNNLIEKRLDENKDVYKISSSAKENKEWMIKHSLIINDDSLKLKEISENLSYSWWSSNEGLNYLNLDGYQIQNIKHITNPINLSLWGNKLYIKSYASANLTMGDIKEEITNMKEKNSEVTILFPETIINKSNELAISLINYNSYPLYNPVVPFISSNTFSLKFFVNETYNPYNDFKNNGNITLSFRKQSPAFNECIFYDEESNNWNTTDCYTQYNDDEYIVCSCTHWTDFSFSSYPINLVYAIFKPENNIKFIDSFDPFKYWTLSNAVVLYIYSGWLFVFLLCLFFTLHYDNGHEKEFFIIEDNGEDIGYCTCSNNAIENKIKQMKKESDNEIRIRKKLQIQQYFVKNVKGGERSGRKLKAWGIDLKVKKGSHSKSSFKCTFDKKVKPAEERTVDEDTNNKNTHSKNINNQNVNSITGHNSSSKSPEIMIEMPLIPVQSDNCNMSSNETISSNYHNDNNDSQDETNDQINQNTNKSNCIHNKKQKEPLKEKMLNNEAPNQSSNTKNNISKPNLTSQTTMPIGCFPTNSNDNKDMKFQELTGDNEGNGKPQMNSKKKRKRQKLEEIRTLKKQSIPHEWFYRIKYLWKLFFITDYRWLVIFLPYRGKSLPMAKTNILVLIITRLATTWSLCALLTECNSKSDKVIYFKRNIVVGISSVWIMEIPFTIMEYFLFKYKWTKNEKNSLSVLRIKRMIIQVVIYIILALIFVYGALNTTWISITREWDDQKCAFITEFIIGTVFDIIVYQILILLSKSLVYYFLIRDNNASNCKKYLIGVLIAFPWAFALNS